MKKLLKLIIIIPTLVLFSCSSSSDSTQSSSDVLLKKEIWSGTTYNYTYQGNKLVKIVGSDGYYSNFTYTGDLITKIESTDGHEEYYYSGNNLIQIKEYIGSVLNRKIDIVFNGDNTRTRTHKNYNGTNTTNVYKDFYVNEECVKSQRLNSNGSIASTTTFLYDNYNCKTKNITGFRYIAGWNDDDSPFHNILKKVETSSSLNFISDFSYEYNSNGYPTTVTSKESGNIIDVGQYFY